MTTTTTTRAAIATPVTRGSTQMLLWTAILAGPVFYASSAVQALAREGFDIRVHPLSQLATGETGWIQTLTFVVAGLGGIALAVAHRRLRSDGLGRRTAPLFIALFGLGFVVAGLFPMDPQNGFPAGAPAEAVPMSWHPTSRRAMKFLLLSYTPADAWDAATADAPTQEALDAFAAYRKFEARLRETGEFVLSEGLGHPAVTTTVRKTAEGVVATDGPFAELKEVLASFAIIECSGIERAREIVAEMVSVLGEPMEIRPIMGDDFA